MACNEHFKSSALLRCKLFRLQLPAHSTALFLANAKASFTNNVLKNTLHVGWTICPAKCDPYPLALFH